jgi:hypothetical protein
MGIDKKSAALMGGALLFIFLFQIVPPIAQDPDYHHFADRRTFFGIPHFRNVASNLPFLLLGTLGLAAVDLKRTPWYLPGLKPVYMMFYGGVFMTGLASAHSHLNPVNETLVWDRLALTIVFMAFFAAVWGEHICATMGLKMVWPLTGIGLASVVYWYVTESLGRGDLRLYGVVQFLPMVLLPVIMITHKSQLTGVAHIWGVIVAYALSKVAEVLDGPIYRALDGFGGHEIKHWVAAAGIFIYYRAGLRRVRRP